MPSPDQRASHAAAQEDEEHSKRATWPEKAGRDQHGQPATPTEPNGRRSLARPHPSEDGQSGAELRSPI